MGNQKHKYERKFDLTSPKKIKRKDAEQSVLNIWREYSRRLTSDFHVGAFDQTKNESAKNFLRREIYALGLTILQSEPTSWGAEDILRSVRTRTNRPDKLGHVFHDLLMSVYEDDSTISRQERHLMAREIEYARRHGISPELLCGFLYQSGPRTQIAKKLKANYREPGFDCPS